ncbi:unnamed protein product, partial [marine sediment metagenome]
CGQEIARFLMRNEDDYNLKNVYFGKYAEEYLHNHPEIVKFETELAEINNQLNLRNATLEGRNDMVVEQINLARELVGSDKESFFKGWLKRRKEQDEPKE